MLLPSLLQNRSQTIPSEGIVGDGQHVTQPQAAGVTHQNPRRQQDSVRAMDRTPRHLRGYRKQVSHLRMRPSTDHRQSVFDTADRPCTIVHYKSVAQGGFPQGAEHPAVIVNRGGGEMTKSIRQVGVDVIDGQIGHPPGESLRQHNELLRVAGTSPRTEGIGSGEINQCHAGFAGMDGGVTGTTSGEIIPHCDSANPPGKISSHRAPLAQLDRIGRCSPPRGWLARIIGGAALASLVLLIFLHGVGTLLTLLALGQLGRAAVLFRRSYRRESLRPTDGASFTEVYR
jgi:hypothetical protein